MLRHIYLEAYLEKKKKNARHRKKTKVVDNCIKIHRTDFQKKFTSPFREISI